jgi:hypothetical protein
MEEVGEKMSCENCKERYTCLFRNEILERIKRNAMIWNPVAFTNKLGEFCSGFRS